MLKNPLTILILISILAALAGLSLTFKTVYLTHRPLPQNENAEEALINSEREKKESDHFILEGLLVNLSQKSNNERIKYLQLDAYIVPVTEAFLTTLEENKFILIDSIIEVASKMSPEELNSITGKILLESRIKKSIHEKLKKELIKEILFQNFIIQ